MTLIFALTGVFVVAPIWYYLLHFLLVQAGASDLQMFLFWVYLPLGLLLQLFAAIPKMVEA